MKIFVFAFAFLLFTFYFRRFYYLKFFTRRLFAVNQNIYLIFSRVPDSLRIKTEIDDILFTVGFITHNNCFRARFHSFDFDNDHFHFDRRGFFRIKQKKYLGIIEARVKNDCTGARWMLDSYANMDAVAKPNVKLRTLTAAIQSNQEEGAPVHKWKLAYIKKSTDWIDNFRTVEQFMAKDLFTVRPEDVIDLAASLMKWKHTKHIPVEDDKGNLIGILTQRDLLSVLLSKKTDNEKSFIVRDVMRTDLVTISPKTTSLKALLLMREKGIGCLPVVKNKKLVGLITSHDFLTVSTRLFEERLREK